MLCAPSRRQHGKIASSETEVDPVCTKNLILADNLGPFGYCRGSIYRHFPDGSCTAHLMGLAVRAWRRAVCATALQRGCRAGFGRGRACVRRCRVVPW